MASAFRSPTLRAVRGPVGLTADVRGRHQGFSTQIMNLSGTGALLATRPSLLVGDDVTLRFSMPGSKEIETTARVARIENGRAGVAFDNLSERDAEMIVLHLLRNRRPTA